MKLRRVWLREVGPFKELDVQFLPGTIPERADVVVITGPNGSGKSTFLRAIASVLDDQGDHLRGRASIPPSMVAVEIDVEGTRNLIGRGLDHAESDGNTLISPTGEAFSPYQRRQVSPSVLQVGGPSAAVASSSNLRTGEQATRTGPVFVFGAFRQIAQPDSLSVVEDPRAALPQHGRFDTPPPPGQLETWIAITRTKLALARDEGKMDEAVRTNSRSNSWREQSPT